LVDERIICEGLARAKHSGRISKSGIAAGDRTIQKAVSVAVAVRELT
jgi:hypothetical protein